MFSIYISKTTEKGYRGRIVDGKQGTEKEEKGERKV